MWWDPSPLVAEPVVYEKLENAAANQQQPHFYHPPTGSREKKSSWIIISLPAKSIQTFSPLLSKIELHSFLLT
jgi:hypothetical protein